MAFLAAITALEFTGADLQIALAIVNILKETTHVDCPWDLIRYGGDKLYVSLFEGVAVNQEPGRCFPAGHASGAYCWLGLFFFARHRFPARQRQVLTGVMTMGLVFVSDYSARASTSRPDACSKD